MFQINHYPSNSSVVLFEQPWTDASFLNVPMYLNFNGFICFKNINLLDCEQYCANKCFRALLNIMNETIIICWFSWRFLTSCDVNLKKLTFEAKKWKWSLDNLIKVISKLLIGIVQSWWLGWRVAVSLSYLIDKQLCSYLSYKFKIIEKAYI